jgi:hypothetical protein
MGPVGDRGFCQQGSEAALLPVALDVKEHVLPLLLGPHASDTGAALKVRAWVTGGADGTRVWFRLNHRILETQRDGGWIGALVPAGLARAGYNVLGICSSEAATVTDRPVIVHRVFVPVAYG